MIAEKFDVIKKDNADTIKNNIKIMLFVVVLVIKIFLLKITPNNK
jgi:hypothetical protein